MPFVRYGRFSTVSRLRNVRRRALRLEALDARAMMAVLPYGAMPDDTGEFMLGDIEVNVVLVESDPTKSTIFGAADPNTEDWTSAEIADVKAKVTEGLDWWKQTLYQEFPQTPPGLLNFDIDFTYADNPFHTGYEPISRPSDYFQYWVSDFLSQVGYSQGGDWSSGIRAFNHAQRVAHGAEWAFTMFIVDNSYDSAHDTVTPGGFAQGGSFTNAFAYAGGRFLVMPASRPVSTVAHETGHMFWALDEYAGPGNYQSSRGYYNTPNTNAANNPAFNASNPQQASIMSNGSQLSDAFAGHESSPTTLAMIGWQDSDNNGIMDVLDKPFSLQGDGWYDESSGEYNFYGRSAVRTLQNRNPSGLQNDITINHIRELQYKVDGEADWRVYNTYDDSSAYSALADLHIPLDPGDHEIRIRTYDTRTHVASDEFVGHTSTPSSIGNGGISGYVWYDNNYNGVYDSGEQANVDFGVELVDVNGQPLNLHKTFTTSQYAADTVVNTVLSGASASALGDEVAGSDVTVMYSPISQQNVFGTYPKFSVTPVTTWNTSTRNLRFDFSQPTTTVSLLAIGAQGAPSFARLDAYNAAGQLVARTTSNALGLQDDQTLIVNRAAGDIKYVIARVFQSGLVEFADLAWGPLGSGTTNFLGGYSFPYLPAGTYYVRPIAPALHISTNHPSGNPSVDLTASGNATVDFGYVLAPNAWHNPVDAYDVNADGSVNIRDATQIISWIRRNAGQSNLMSQTASSSSNYIDVNYDGLGNVADAIAVIRQLRRQASMQSGGESADSATPQSGAPASDSAAGYYQGQAVHFRNINVADDDEETVSSAAVTPPVANTAAASPADSAPAVTNAPSAPPTSSPVPPPPTNVSASHDLFWQLATSNYQPSSKRTTSLDPADLDLLASNR